MIHGMVLVFEPYVGSPMALREHPWKPTCLCGWTAPWFRTEYEALAYWQEHVAEAMGFCLEDRP